MFIPAKFICRCFSIGALALLGMALLRPPSTGNRPNAQGAPSSAADALLENAAVQADSIYRQASIQFGPQLQSFYADSSVFVRSNATTGRLQLEGIGDSLSYNLSIDAWRQIRTPYWIQTGFQGAVQATGEQTLSLARSMPIVIAVRSDLDRFANAHPSFSSVASGY
jgi:hypothetical protein